MTNSNDLLMLTADEIDYTRLSTEELTDLALAEDMFIATSALPELLTRNKQEAAAVALAVLSKETSDQYLQAQALEVLFSADPPQGLSYIRQNMATFDAYMRKTVETLIAENQSIFMTELTNLIRKLKSELDTILQAEDISQNIDLSDLPLVIDVETASLNLLDTLNQLRIKAVPRK